MITELSISFSNNIISNSDTLFILEDMTAGLPENYKKKRLQPDGTYAIDLSYPSFDPFMKYSDIDSLRKTIRFMYLNIGYPENITILDEIILNSNKIANLLGYSSYAEYTLEEAMAKTPHVVWTFENMLRDSVQAKANRDKREMLEISRYVFNNTDGVNHYNPGSGYLNYVRYEIDNFPMSRYDYESPNILWDYYDPNSGTNYTFDSIEKYVEFGQSRNLTHIVTNGHNADPDILNDLFFNENNYPYVEKQFDSFENGFKINHIKIFKINFELFDKYNNND